MKFLSARQKPDNSRTFPGQRQIRDPRDCRPPPEACKSLKNYTKGQETQM
jgi:hypothetical protein